MKALLIICCSLIAMPAMAQQKKDTPPGTMPNVPLFKTDSYRLSPPNYFDRKDITLPYTYRINAVPPGVYNLPQDNMPCIVPNTFGMTPIPNAFPVKQLPFKSYIPNAVPFNRQAPGVIPQTK